LRRYERPGESLEKKLPPTPGVQSYFLNHMHHPSFGQAQAGTVGVAKMSAVAMILFVRDLLDHSTLGKRRSYQCMSDRHSMDE
jgi:hypothetical protein